MPVRLKTARTTYPCPSRGRFLRRRTAAPAQDHNEHPGQQLSQAVLEDRLQDGAGVLPAPPARDQVFQEREPQYENAETEPFVKGRDDQRAIAEVIPDPKSVPKDDRLGQRECFDEAAVCPSSCAAQRVTFSFLLRASVRYRYPSTRKPLSRPEQDDHGTTQTSNRHHPQKAERHERVCSCSHSHHRRRNAPCRTSGCNLSPAVDLDVKPINHI